MSLHSLWPLAGGDPYNAYTSPSEPQLDPPQPDLVAS